MYWIDIKIIFTSPIYIINDDLYSDFCDVWPSAVDEQKEELHSLEILAKLKSFLHGKIILLKNDGSLG